jgi:hypothetical protein
MTGGFPPKSVDFPVMNYTAFSEYNSKVFGMQELLIAIT